MMKLQDLFHYKVAIELFIKFLMNNNYNPKAILLTNVVDSLGYILSFLESQSIYILTDKYSLLMYTTGTTDHSKQYVELTRTIYIIKQIELKKKSNVIVNYEYAIDEAFKFLEAGF
jgi:hypothetical protein